MYHEPEPPTFEPEIMSAEPEHPSVKPETKLFEPELPSTEPEGQSPEPETPLSEPEGMSPETPLVEPEGMSLEPELPTVEPEKVSPEPEPLLAEPEGMLPEPEVSTIEPEGMSPEPESPLVEPEGMLPEPEFQTIEPEIMSPEPETPLVEPEGMFPEPEVPTIEPEGMSPVPELPLIEPEGNSLEPELPTVEHEGMSPEPKPSVEPESKFPSVEPELTSPESESELFLAEPEFANTSFVSDAEPEVQSQEEAEPESWPEPGPDWTKALETWGRTWELHVYTFAGIYAVIAFISLIVLVGIFATRQKLLATLKTKATTVCHNTLMLGFGLTRSIVLLLDPYGSNKVLQFLVWRLFWSASYPCLTAGFSITLLVLLDTTKMSIGPPRFQRLSVLLSIISLHFIIVLLTDILIYTNLAASILLLLCQILTSLWGLAIAVGYAVVGYKIHKNLCLVFHASDEQGQQQNRKIARLKKIILCSALVGFFYAGTNIYGAVGVFGVLSSDVIVDEWPWFAFQSASRLEEISMCILIMFIAVKIPSAIALLPLPCFGQNGCFRRRKISTQNTPFTATCPVSDFPTLKTSTMNIESKA